MLTAHRPYTARGTIALAPVPVSMVGTMHDLLVAELQRCRDRLSMLTAMPRYAQIAMKARIEWQSERVAWIREQIAAIETAIEDGKIPLDEGTVGVVEGWPLARLARADLRGAIPHVELHEDGTVTVEGIDDRYSAADGESVCVRWRSDLGWCACDPDEAEALVADVPEQMRQVWDERDDR